MAEKRIEEYKTALHKEGQVIPARELHFEVRVDAEPAVKALKSITRAAKEAMQSLREVEASQYLASYRLPTQYISVNIDGVPEMIAEPIYKPLSEYTTAELHEELAKREGVREMTLLIDNEYEIADKNGMICVIQGPARILINED
jgi:hypothetical protein